MVSAVHADKVDPRVRTYIDPVRVVWQSKSTLGYGTRMQAQPVLACGVDDNKKGKVE